MKMILLVLALFTAPVWARETMSIGAIENEQEYGSCPIHNKQLQENIQKRVAKFLGSYPEFSVVKGPARYMVTGAVHRAEHCRKSANFAVELKVYDNRLKKWAFAYTSEVKAEGAGVLAETMELVVRDVTFRVERALTNRRTVASAKTNGRAMSPATVDFVKPESY